MIKKIKPFIIPCVLTMLWIFLLMEVCQILDPLACLLGFSSEYFYYSGYWTRFDLLDNVLYNMENNFPYIIVSVFTLIVYISLALSVPFVFSTVCKRYSIDDKSEIYYLLLAIFSLVFCRLSWTKSFNTKMIYRALAVLVLFIVLTAIAALVLYIFKLIFKNKQPSRKVNIYKHVVVAVMLFIIAYIVLPYIAAYISTLSLSLNEYRYNFLLMFLPVTFSGMVEYSLINCLASSTTFPSVIFTLITLLCYYVIAIKPKEGLVKNTIASIISSMVVATIVLLIYRLLLIICNSFSDSENSILEYMHYWIPGTVLMLLSSFVPLAFLAAFDARNKKGEHKVFKYVAYTVMTIVFYAAILPESLENIFTLIYVDFLTFLFYIIPFVFLAICIVSEKQGKPFTAKIYTLFNSLLKNLLKPLENGRQTTAVKPDKLKVIKQRTLKQLGGKIFASAWLMFILVIIIHGFITGAVAFTLIGALLVGGPMQYGLTKLQMKLVKEEDYKVDLSDLFKGFSENFTQSIVLGFLQSLFTALWSMLFVIPGIIKSYSYSMAFYIQTESNDKSWKHALNESKRLMHGNKFKLLLLDLSFIGWYIVGSMCLGIGIIFVLPYHNQARANFYASIMQNDLKTASATENVEVTVSTETVEIEDNSATA